MTSGRFASLNEAELDQITDSRSSQSTKNATSTGGMDYDKVVKKIGGFGRCQKYYLFLLSLSSVFNALTTYALNFVIVEHNHRCRVPGVNDDHYSPPGSVLFNTTSGIQEYNVTECTIEINGSTTKCHSWVYDQSLYTATIISKFDVVCDDKFSRAHLLMSYYVGLLVGSVTAGIMSDTLGRKPVLMLATICLLLSEGIRPFLPTYTVVVLVEFLNGFGTVIFFISPFVLITELVEPSKRLLGSFILYITYVLSSFLLLLIAYFVRDWSHLLWINTVFVAPYIIIIFFISESPRWLLSRGRKKDAVVILKKIAEMNRKDFSIIAGDITVKADNIQFLEFTKTMLRSKTLMVRLSIIALNWVALSMTYYGITFNIGKFGGNIFINSAISSLVEVVAIIFCMVFTDRIGHKRLYCSLMILGSVSCFCNIFPSLYAADRLDWLTTTLAMTGKCFVSAAFFIAYLYTAELFPTVLRASVLGVSSMSGRVGAISSAYIGELGTVITTKFGMALPLTIFGAVGLVAGLLTLLLPETTHMQLPELVYDAEMINRTGNNRENGHELEALT